MPFRHLAVVWNPEDPATGQLAQSLAATLEADGYAVVRAPLRVHDGAAEEHVAAEAMAGAELALVFGGDGTLLASVRALAGRQVPLLGVNRGHLGFLVDLTAEHLATELREVLSGTYRIESRLTLEGAVERAGRTVQRLPAFNEVAIHKWDSLSMIELETRVDGMLLHRQRGDGVIVSTPTGSTAYALSAGGPIVHPTLDALVMVPVCTHTLAMRPMVLGPQAVTLTLTDARHARARAVWDGQRSVPLEVGDRLTVQPRPGGVTLLHPHGYDYFERLRSKLHWGR